MSETSEVVKDNYTKNLRNINNHDDVSIDLTAEMMLFTETEVDEINGEIVELGDDGDIGSGNSNITVSTGDGNEPSSDQVQIPDDVFVPEYLTEFLNSLTPTEQLGKKYLLQVGADALKYKIRGVEEFNMSVKSGKKRIPETLNFVDVAVILMTMYTFKNVQLTNRVEDTTLAIYDSEEGVYDTNIRKLYKIIKRIAPSFKRRDMEDVLHHIEDSVKSVEPTKDKDLSPVNNGIYSRRMNRLMPFDRNYVYLTKSPVNYKRHPIKPRLTAPDGYLWDVDSWISDLFNGDQDVIDLMWQIIADCLQPNISRHKSVWFVSEKGNNGKGTLGQLIKNLLGEGNYSSLSVADFNHEFAKETLLGVMANIADENDVGTYLESAKDFKASITGDDININRKHKDILRLKFCGTNIQMMNGLPTTKDKTDSFYRRILPVPFLKSFTNNGERKYIKTDFINQNEVLEYVLHKALSLDFDEFIMPLVSSQLLAKYKEDNNPVLNFWNELKDEFVWDLLPTRFVYDLYKQWRIMDNPSGKTLRSREFYSDLIPIIESQGEWRDSRKKSVRSKGRMDKGEPLIRTYGLYKKDSWNNPGEWNYLAYDQHPPVNGVGYNQRKDTYKGLERI